MGLDVGERLMGRGRVDSKYNEQHEDTKGTTFTPI
jgi:hypothetical protein